MKQQLTGVEYIKLKLLGDEYWYENLTFDNIFEQAEKIDKRLKHESIESQVAILKDTLDEMMTGFDSEEDRMDFILDICNGYKKRIETKQQEQ
jgi:hypothetical protein